MRDRAIVEAGERLVEQHQPRPMQQRALEREPLAHAAREAATPRRRRGRPARRARAPRRRRGARSRPYSCGEERQVLPRRQLGIEMQLVREQADAAAQRRRRAARAGSLAVARPRRCVGATSVASMPISVDLPAPFGPSRPTMSPARAVSETCDERAAAAEVARDVDELDAIEIEASRRSRGDACGALRRVRARCRRCRARCRRARARRAALRAAPRSARRRPCRARGRCSSRTSSLNSFSRRAISRLRSAARAAASPVGRVADPDADERRSAPASASAIRRGAVL